MAVEVFKEIPRGIQALEEKISDLSIPKDTRDGLWTTCDYLSRSASPFEPRGSRNSWTELLYTVTSDTTISATSTETIMVPDFPLPANYLVVGRCLRYRLLFDVSTVITTPGTLTFRLRYGGVGGTVLVVSGAYAPDPAAASTQTPMMVEYYLTMRADGVSGSAFVMGVLTMSDMSATVATLAAQLNNSGIPTGSPAAVTINTTTANALSPTSTASVTTGSLRTRLAYLEAMN